MFERFKKTIVGFLLVLFFASGVLGTLFIPQPAHANIPVAVVTNLPATASTIVDQIYQGLKSALLGAVGKLVSFTIRKIAYDSAVWLASGGKGQSPFAQTKNFGDYIKNVGDQAFGQAIEGLSKGIGVNLCKIPDIKTDLSLKIGLRAPGIGGANDPGSLSLGGGSSCSFSEFQKNWGSGDAWKSKFSTAGKNITEQFNSALSNAGQSDFGLQIGASQDIARQVTQSYTAAQLQRLEGQGYLPKTDLISGRILTPAGIVKKDFEKNTPGDQQEKDEQLIWTYLQTQDIKVIPNILSIFLSTLGSTMVKNFQEKGVLPFGICVGDYGGEDCKNKNPAANYDGSGVLGGRQAAQDLFSSFLAVQIDSSDDYDILSQLNNCPDSPGIYNCRADNSLVNAVKQSSAGEPVTIGDAIKSGLISGSWKLYPPTHSKNVDQNCYKDGFCYNNVKVLRQVRILPLGFEIAAKLSDPDRPWTLKQVVDGFNDCNYTRNGGNISGATYDPANKPFCHLIDPNWVLKAPITRCNAIGAGSTLLSNGSTDRMMECADLSTCINYDRENKKCVSYGACTREKNVWAFSAKKCEAQFATCQTYADTQTGGTFSYLYRTLDTGACTKNNAGCTFYSLSKTATGTWKNPGLNAISNSNNGVYFNNKVQTCTAQAVGCTAVVVASSTNNTLLFARQAPEYLGCYDSDPGTAGIQWPQTAADLNRIRANPTCAQYAGVCTPEEIGCNLFTPIVTDKSTAEHPVPGKINTADVMLGGDTCQAQCVGYNSYREMPSTYSGGQNTTYIIPSSGKTCTAAEDGCSSFTNLSTDRGGVEQVEYFSFLQPCVTTKDPVQKGKNFFTYEGSTVGGFQLKTFTLVVNDATDKNFDNATVGAPKYFYKTLAKLQQFASQCNETLYKSGKSNGDCREFFDNAGTRYYRLLSQTIPVTDSCIDYRLNTTELYALDDQTINTQALCENNRHGRWDVSDPNNPVCQVCYQNGEYDKKIGSCIYQGLPAGVQNNAGISRSCTKEVDTCRPYKGNTGNNIEDVFKGVLTFESPSTSLAGWGPNGVIISPESTHAGEHSLGYVGSDKVTKQVILTPEESYDITFWAKGTGQNLTVSIETSNQGNKYSKSFGAVGVSDTWRYYHLGPMRLSADGFTFPTSSEFALTFQNQVKGSLFIDNIQLVRVKDLTYLVKNSLRVDPACDSNLDDNLPGEALGCRAYTDRENKVFNLTNFSYLCRDNAIGCTAVLNTQNTLTKNNNKYQVTASDQGPRAYNIWLPGTGGASATAVIGGDTYSCSVPVGAAGCYVADVINHDKSAVMTSGQRVGTMLDLFVTSTLYFTADSLGTSSTNTQYLVINKKEDVCNEIDLGCTFAGVAKQGPNGFTYTTATIKNDPALYTGNEGILCQNEALGCQEFNTGGGSVFFKDPKNTGQKICSYRTDVPVKGVKTSGWFWKGVGTCSNKPSTFCTADTDCGAKKVCQNDPASSCNQDADCGDGDSCVATNFQCSGINDQPCYPDYFQGGGSYGLWSYGVTDKYKNFVGECPATQDKCTEFVDHADKNTSYFLIKDDRITGGDCNGQVSQSKGCALFDEKSNPNKYWSTRDTYQRSEALDSQLVPPTPNPDPTKNDANILIKVTRDRECGEWIQCRSSHSVWDASRNRWKTICDAIGRCDKLTADGNSCAHWVNQGEQILTEADYINHPASWSFMDYAGFSILGTYPLEQLSQIDISPTTTSSDWRLVKFINCGTGSNCVNSQNAPDYACKPGSGPAVCGVSGEGMCVNDYCVQTPTGDGKTVVTAATAQSCRTYPEKDSPFPNLLENDPKSAKGQAFANAHRCQETADNATGPTAYACDCDYTKAQYGDAITKYWNYSNPNKIQPVANANGGGTTAYPQGICYLGEKDGQACTKDDDCKSGGTASFGSCVPKKREFKWLGWHGYCVEEDESRSVNGDPNKHPCLTWLPVDSLAGNLDINNQHTDAGYVAPAKSGRYYCVNSNGGGGRLSSGGVQSVWAPNGNNSAFENYYTVSQQVRVALDGTGYRKTFVVSDFVNPIYLPDIDKITIEVLGGRVGDPGPLSPRVGSKIDMYPNRFVTGTSQSERQFLEQGGDEGLGASDIGYAVTGFYQENLEQPIYMYGSSVAKNTPTRHIGNKNVNAPDDTTNPQDKGHVRKDGVMCSLAGHYCDTIGARNATLDFFCFDKNECSGIDGGLKGSLFDKKNPPISGGKSGDVIWDNAAAQDSICKKKPTGASEAEPGEWHGIRFKFNPNTKRFEGYDTVNCNPNPGNGTVYLISFRLREYCRNIADVNVGWANPQTDTVPWTDRLWKQGVLSINKLTWGGPAPTSYDYSLDASPFGSLLTTTEPPSVGAVGPVLISANLPPNYDIANCPATDPNKPPCYNAKLANGSTDPISVFGAPFGCSPFGCVRSSASLPPADGNSIFTNAGTVDDPTSLNLLGNLFARIKQLFVFDTKTKNYTTQPAPFDYTAGGAPGLNGNTINPLPPLVHPAVDCSPKGECTEPLNDGFTINAGDGDKSFDDVKIFTDFAPVIMKFYAAANSDQMPIRQVKVDWGDNTPGYSGLGAYRNHRGLNQMKCNRDPVAGPANTCMLALPYNQVSCDPALNDLTGNNPACVDHSGLLAAQPKCDRETKHCYYLNQPDGNSVACTVDAQCANNKITQCVPEDKAKAFGYIIGRTCDNTNFQFEHTYQCVENGPGWQDVCPDSKNFPAGCCVFKPRVQVTDNWGWCTGTCNHVDGGCYGAECGDSSLNSKAWVKFGGDGSKSVLVAPPPSDN